MLFEVSLVRHRWVLAVAECVVGVCFVVDVNDLIRHALGFVVRVVRAHFFLEVALSDLLVSGFS